MDKLKLKLTHMDALLFVNRLEDTICIDGIKQETKMQKLFAFLWLETFIKMKAKTTFVYQGAKSFSLSFPQAMAFEQLLQKWHKADEEKNDEATIYRRTLYLSTISFIDQKTA